MHVHIYAFCIQKLQLNPHTENVFGSIAGCDAYQQDRKCRGGVVTFENCSWLIKFEPLYSYSLSVIDCLVIQSNLEFSHQSSTVITNRQLASFYTHFEISSFLSFSPFSGPDDGWQSTDHCRSFWSSVDTSLYCVWSKWSIDFRKKKVTLF